MPTVTQNSPRFEKVFIQQQTALRTAADGTSAQLLRAVGRTKLTGGRDIVAVPWKTGTRSTQPGILGRWRGAFELRDFPLIPSGTAGGQPDAWALIEGITGLAGSSGTYNFSDTGFKPFTLFDYQHGLSGGTQQMVYGCIPADVTFNFNTDIFNLTCTGLGVYKLDSDYFASEAAAAKGGLSAYPAEPSTTTTTGAVIPGFFGAVTMDSHAFDHTTAVLKNFTVRVVTGSRPLNDTYDDGLPSFAVGGERKVSITLGVVDNDSAELIDIKQKTKAGTPFNISIDCGNLAGYIVRFVMKDFQFAQPEYADETDHVMCNFGESFAHASAVGNIDDLSLVFA
jgi:hypothetical protein